MDKIYEKMLKTRDLRKKEIPDKFKKFKESSKKQLSKISEKKIRTSFIGAISQFEKSFGHLWGLGKHGRLTEDELKMKLIWNLVRSNILNNGNRQIRALLNELEQYSIEWKGYCYNTVMNNSGSLRLEKE